MPTSFQPVELETTKDNLKNFIERWEEHPNSPYVFDNGTNIIAPLRDARGDSSISSRGKSSSELIVYQIQTYQAIYMVSGIILLRSRPSAPSACQAMFIRGLVHHLLTCPCEWSGNLCRHEAVGSFVHLSRPFGAGFVQA